MYKLIITKKKRNGIKIWGKKKEDCIYNINNNNNIQEKKIFVYIK